MMSAPKPTSAEVVKNEGAQAELQRLQKELGGIDPETLTPQQRQKITEARLRAEAHRQEEIKRGQELLKRLMSDVRPDDDSDAPLERGRRSAA